MTDEHGKDHEFEELEPLETLDDVEEMHELEPLDAAGAGSGEAAPEAAPEAALEAAAGAPGKRELEQTPIILRKASMILFAGSMLPWLIALKAVADVPVDWKMLYTAKAVALLAAWIFHQGFLATHGGPAVGAMKKLAGIHPLVAPGLAGIVSIAAISLVFGPEGLDSFAASAEIATLLLAAATFSHIWGYEHGGKFNPIYPIMFLGPALAGLLSVFGAAAQFKTNAGLAVTGLAGCLTVGAGGCMAIYALYVAMKQAKTEGDEKRRLQREHRKASRSSRRSS